MTSAKYQSETFEESYISKSRIKVTEKFEVYVLPALKWIQMAFKDASICDVASWYPQKKWIIENGIKTQMHDDLDCGQDWWDIQSEIGSKGSYLPLVLYADATLVSSFNGRQFHPIIGRFGVIPGKIRNSYGRGGGTLLGLGF
ncbi:hypothetical protein SISNIDRAFT_488319 [Sistotremastrum niveocremeum HHB9708]|uniref:Uncharacterized protein n=1 Tax=Sistotremastrum niveocremeum HHB9708 TaxID=1314777 RepID=A0A164RC50_9AGAM|nr:hypothetical protein SISNIDRAFT_488319 [Sistotremastrum niveocremeum HHB9708]